MANVIQTTQNNTEPLVLASDAKARDHLTMATGVFVKGEVVYVNGSAIAKFVPATNVPNAILLDAHDASGGALTNITALTKGEVDEGQLEYNGGDASTNCAVYGIALSTRQCLELAGIYPVNTRKVMAQQS